MVKLATWLPGYLIRMKFLITVSKMRLTNILVMEEYNGLEVIKEINQERQTLQ